MDGPNPKILEHDWKIYLREDLEEDFSTLTPDRVRQDGFEDHLSILYDGDLERAIGEYVANKAQEEASRGSESSNPLEGKLQDYFSKRAQAEKMGVPVLPIEMENFSDPDPENIEDSIYEALEKLTDQERSIMEELYILGGTYKGIAFLLEMSENDVYDIEQVALEKMALYARHSDVRLN
jgi:Txe/YoeB family toxin of Txe-Axe toxin-antitoxin module